MPAEVLILCAQCGRPQFANRDSCVACGARLPEAVPTSPPSARDKLLAEHQPFVEMELGRHRKLLLSERRLEWQAGRRTPHVAELALLKSVLLSRRRPREVLGIAAAAGLGALLLSGAGKVLLAAVAVLAVAAWALQRRYDLVLVYRSGARVSFLLGIGRRASAVSYGVESIWATLGAELRRLGVETAEVER